MHISVDSDGHVMVSWKEETCELCDLIVDFSENLQLDR